ncbi:hypothetical protein [Gimibacter soli]|uniref:Capsular polysaccharide transport system permease protein n=1 Tax=Gimibacter soli TaxID=3024400 RepID=A0AAF0BMW8_9PROT|nr:hypothetical protein [Gimibacter soli]WCL55111.1 hypothetical protein PH603_04985 [Gimibacter soli]
MMSSLEKLKGAVAQRLDRRGETALRRSVVPDIRRRMIGLGSYRWVLVLFAIAAFYYVAMASNRYVAVAGVYVKASQSEGGDVSQIGLLSGLGSNHQDSTLLQDFIHSQDMLRKLDEKVGLRAHYSSRDWDFISRLDDDATVEDFLQYYQDHVTVQLSGDSGVLTVEVQGFDRDAALLILQTIIAEAETFINDVGHQVARAEIDFVEGEMKRAQERLNAARERMLDFQSTNKIISPVVSGQALQGVVNELSAQLVQLKAEERAYADYLNDDATQLISTRNRIAAIEAQIEAEKAKLTSGAEGALNELTADYQEMEIDLQLATNIYQATLVGYEKARVEAYRKLKHLVVVQAPARPDEALYPRILYNLTTLFVLLSLAYGIIMMTIATIREHRDV